MPELLIGAVGHYYSRIDVAALTLEGTLRVGDRIHILGHTTDLTQVVDSIQIEHSSVDVGGPGADVAIKVAGKVRAGDKVYRVVEEGALSVS